MRSTRSGRLVVAMEEEQARLEAEAAEAATAQKQTEDEIAAAADERVQEVTETHDDVEELDDSVEDLADEHQGIDEAMDTVEAMESLAAVIGAAKNAGTMTRVAAEAMFVMIDHVDRRTGYKAESKVSLESFGGPSATKRSVIALEGEITDRVKKIYEAIKAAIKRAIEWIKNFALSLAKNASRLHQRAADLTTSFNREWKGTGGVIESEKLFASLQMSGKVPSDASGAETVRDLIGEFYADLPRAAGIIEKNADHPMDGADNILSALNALKGLPDLRDHKAVEIHGLAESDKVVRSKELPGGKALVGAVMSSDSADLRVYVAIDPFDVRHPAVAGSEVPALSREDANRQVGMVLMFSKCLMDGKKQIAAINKAKEKAIASLDKAIRAASVYPKLGSEEGRAEIAGMRIMTAAVRILDAPFSLLSSYGIRVGYDLLDHAEKSSKPIKASNKRTASAA